MSSVVQQRAVEIMLYFANVGTPYGYGAGHSRSDWNVHLTLSDGTGANVPSTTDCSGAVICAYENAHPGCTGGADDTSNMKDCFLSTGLWKWHQGDYYMARAGDIYLTPKNTLVAMGHTAVCTCASPDLLVELIPAHAVERGFYEYPWLGTLEYIGGNSGSSPTPDAIPENGYWGRATTTALQHHYGTVADGEVWHQWAPNVAANPVLLAESWKCDNTLLGSPVIRAIQNDLGVAADGIMGPGTISAINSLFNGVYGSGGALSVGAMWEMQHQLNGGTWPFHL